MRKLLAFFTVFLLLLSCQDVEKVKKPKNLIAEEKMVEVLTELSLLNAARSYNLKQLQNTGIEPGEYLYKKYGIDSVQFAVSNKYYTANIETYKTIFDSVKKNLEELKVVTDSLLAIERERQDSITKTKSPSFKTNRDSLFKKRMEEVINQR